MIFRVRSIKKPPIRVRASAARAAANTADARASSQENGRPNQALMQTLSRLRLQASIVDRLSIISETDPRGVIIHVNDNFCRISGYSRDELIGRTHAILNSRHHPKQFWTDMYAALARGEVWQADVCNRAKDGSLYWVKSANAAVRCSDGKLQGYTSLRLDVTEGRELQAQLAAQSLQLDMVLKHMPGGISMFDCEQRLLVCNDRYTEMYGLPPELTRPGMPLADLMCYEINGKTAASSPEMLKEQHKRIAEYLARMSSGQPFTYKHFLGDGRCIRVSAGPMPDGGWVDAHEDITHQLSLETRIAHLALHDGLTGLANRTHLDERFEQALESTDAGQSIAVLCLDLDHFKEVNDTLGHAVGDALLKTVAERIKSCVRRTDTVARVGGDEFVVLQISMDPLKEAAVLAERIIEKVCAPYSINGHQIIIGTSIGIAISPRHGREPDTLLRNADIALYHSKAARRGTYQFFEDDLIAQRGVRRTG